MFIYVSSFVRKWTKAAYKLTFHSHMLKPFFVLLFFCDMIKSLAFWQNWRWQKKIFCLLPMPLYIFELATHCLRFSFFLSLSKIHRLYMPKSISIYNYIRNLHVYCLITLSSLMIVVLIDALLWIVLLYLTKSFFCFRCLRLSNKSLENLTEKDG